MTEPVTQLNLAQRVEDIVSRTPVVDMHTHLFAPEMTGRLLSGADELLTYHYLVAEAFRVHQMAADEFWKLSKPAQAEIIWESLFTARSPVSEAARGVLTVSRMMGGAAAERPSLARLRALLASQPDSGYVDRVLTHAGVQTVVMTNDPFDADEARFWRARPVVHQAFRASLRLDPLFERYSEALVQVRRQGYAIDAEDLDRVRRPLTQFLGDWLEHTGSLYAAWSPNPDFSYDKTDVRTRVLDEVVLPVLAERGVPLALMVGAKRRVNPRLREAGDAVEPVRLEWLSRMIVGHPEMKWLVTALSRENQHELVVLARKFSRLMIFGCWWFLNTPDLIDDMTRMRLDLLGLTFIPQHSDARVLEQLLYKWNVLRERLTQVLTDRYQRLWSEGWQVTEAEICRDVDGLLHDNFWNFINLR